MMIRLYFLRHASAEEPVAGLPDAERALTEKGLRQSRLVASFCARQGLLPAVLLTSPLLRSVQTAAAFSAQLHDCPPPEVVEWLRLGTSAAEAVQHLRERLGRAEGHLCLVGHEPDLSDLISRLLGSDDPIVRIKKASLTCIEIDPAALRHGQLLWSVPCALMG
ncbi:MAG: hypothetical protein RLY71_409 [Pseudomonadota bacterium]|jgi:phosphohistidine phosphatase